MQLPSIAPESAQQASAPITPVAAPDTARPDLGLILKPYEATEQLSKTGQAVGSTMLDYANVKAARDAQTQFQDWSLQQDSQFHQLKGQAAVDAYPQYLDAMNKQAQAIGSNLSPEAQKDFLSNASMSMFYVKRNAMSYIDEQQNKAENDSRLASGATALRTIPMAISSGNYDLSGLKKQFSESLVNPTDDPLTQDMYRDKGKQMFDYKYAQELGAQQPEKTIKAIQSGAFPDLDPVQGAVLTSSLLSRVNGQIAERGFAGTPDATVRGIRNNNPGNLEDSGSQWQGMTGKDSGGYLQFNNPQNGLRALAIDLVNQKQLHGLDTVQGIIGKYAPPDENNTRAYETYVSKQLGISPTAKIDMSNPDTVSRLMSSIITIENKGNPYDANAIKGAATLATAKLSGTQGLMDQTNGNPQAQLEIAKNATVYTSPAQDAQMVASANGDAKQTLQQAVIAKQALLTSDPASFIASHNIDVQQGVSDALQNHPERMPHFISEMDAIYSGQGQPENNRPILTQQQQQSLVSSITSKPMDQGAKSLYSMESNYGAAFPRIYADLVRGGLPPQYQVLMNIDNQVARERLVRAYAGNPSGKDITQALGQGTGSDATKDKTTIDNAIDKDDGFRSYLNTLSASGASTGAVASYRDTVKRLAYQGKLEGDSVGDASTNAMQAVSGKYQIFDKTARIPTPYSAVTQQNANFIRDNLTADNVTIPYYAQSPELYIHSITHNSQFVTNNDESGLWLKDQAGGFVRTASGSRLTIPFSQTLNKNLVQKQKQDAASDAKDYSDMGVSP